MNEICSDFDENRTPSAQRNEKFYGSTRGLVYALIVLIGNGIHPIINNMRPEELNSTIFVLQMSIWEFLCALIALLIQTHKKKKNQSTFKVEFQKCYSKKHIFFRMLSIGLIFSVATYGYVDGLTKAGSISGSIALKISPIYAIIIGFLFLGEKINSKQILITFIMLLGIYYLGTRGTFKIDDFSIGFAILLVVPLLWTIAHALTKPLLENGILNPNQVIFIRTGVISISFFIVNLIILGWSGLISSFINPKFLFFSFLMGCIYFLMHFSWYSSITIIDLSYASALVTPSPAITTLIAILLKQEKLNLYQVIGMIWVFAGLYGLILISKTEKNEKKHKYKKIKK